MRTDGNTVSFHIEGPDLQVFLAEDVPVDTLVRDIAREVAYGQYGITSLVKLRVSLLSGDEDSSGLGDETVLDLGSTLAVAGVRDGSTLRISPVAWAGGFSLPEVSFYLGSAMASGMVGNLAYDIAKSALADLRERWQGSTLARRRATIAPQEAREIARGCISAMFDVDADSLSPVAVLPIVLRWDGTGIRKLRNRRLPGLFRTARAWRCVFAISEEPLPGRIEVIVQANSTGADHTYVYLLPNA